MRKRDVARYIMDALPTGTGRNGVMPADQLALVLLLEASGPLTVGAIADAFKRPQASTSDLIDRAEAALRVERVVGPVDRRVTLVHIAARTVRERERSRGGRRHAPYAARWRESVAVAEEVVTP